MKKTALVVLVMAVLISSMALVATASNSIRIFVNGKEIYSDVKPQIIDGRVMVPVRFVSDALGANIEWNQDTYSVNIYKSTFDKAKADSLLVLEAQEGNIKEVNKLLEMGADPNAHTKRTDNKISQSALSLASEMGHVDVVKALLLAGADPNLRDDPRTNNTPIMIASVNNHVQVVKVLLAMGADINAQNFSGHTALMMSTLRSGNIETAKTLLMNGANPNIRNNEGKTALGMATGYGNKEIADLIKHFRGQL